MISSDSKYPREFQISEILIISWKFYFENFSNIFLIVFLISLPFNYLLEIIPVYRINNFMTEKYDIYKDYWIVLSILAISIFAKISNVAISLMVKNFLNNTENTLISITKLLFSRLKVKFLNDLLTIISLLGVFSLIYFSLIISKVLFLLILIPMVVFLFYWIFAEYVYTFRNLTIYNALQYSYSVVHGRWASVFGKSLLILFFTMLATAFLGSLKPNFLNLFAINILFNSIVNGITSYFIVVFAVFFVNYDDTAYFNLNPQGEYETR